MSAPRPPASPIDALPAQTVRRLGSIGVEELRRWAAENGHRFVLAECSDCVDKEAVLRSIGRAFGFPEWYGANLDALYDCLTDLPDQQAPGWVVVLARLPREPGFGAEQREALLDVFRDAAEAFADRGIGLRVFYG
jgi:RNAse (barnase) inhibitor barstar